MKTRFKGGGTLANSHPKPHPIYFHGQRFLVLSVNGKNHFNMAWKGMHLIGNRETVGFLLDTSLAQRWSGLLDLCPL